MDFEQLPLALVEGIISYKKDFFFRAKLEHYASYLQREFFTSLKKWRIEREFSTDVDDQGVIKISEKNQPFNTVTLSEEALAFSLSKVALEDLEKGNTIFNLLVENLQNFRNDVSRLIWDFLGLRLSAVFPFIQPKAGQIIKESFFNEICGYLNKVTTNTETDLVNFHIATRDKQMRYRLRVDSSSDNKAVTVRFEIEKPLGGADADINFSEFAHDALRSYKEVFRSFAERLMYTPEFNESFFRTFF